VLICTVDNVGSHQMQKVRISLRGKAVLLMGKNTICRKAIREHQEWNRRSRKRRKNPLLNSG